MNDFKFEFKRSQISKIPREKIIFELEKVAKHFNYTDFRQDDFDKLANVSAYTVYREFGSWDKVMNFLVDYFKEKDIEFNIITRRSNYTIQEMFDEMEKIWVQLGHRPSRNEWQRLQPKISYDTIYRQFNGWTNACLKFIEYKSGGMITSDEEISSNSNENKTSISSSTLVTEKAVKPLEKSRTIPLSMRIKVLSRDNFRCVFCGKSPATDLGTKLHIDHIIPFSKGGESTEDNLQTLCFDCNIGKSNKDITI